MYVSVMRRSFKSIGRPASSFTANSLASVPGPASLVPARCVDHHDVRVFERREQLSFLPVAGCD